jgi:hypothetical protein
MAQFILTPVEQAAAETLRALQPQMTIRKRPGTAPGWGQGEVVVIRGIRLAGANPRGQNPLDAQELRAVAQAVRAICEDLQHGGERLTAISVQPDGDSYTLECRAEEPGQILTPLSEKLNLTLRGEEEKSAFKRT